MKRKTVNKLMAVVFAALWVMLVIVSAGTVSATDSEDMDIQAEIRNIWSYDAMSPILLFGQNANLGQVVQADLSADSFSDPLPTYDSRCLGLKNYDKLVISRFREGNNKVRIVMDITGGTGFKPGSEGHIKITNPDYKITKIYDHNDYIGVLPPTVQPPDLFFLHNDHFGFGRVIDMEEGSISWQGRGTCPACACRENYFRMEFLVEKVVSNEPPIANAGGPYESGEGSPIIFDASGSSDSDGDLLTYRWDFDNDGTWDTGWSSSPTASHTWNDDWIGTANLEVSDGELTDTDTASVTVNNVAPTVDVSSDQTVDEGDIVSFYGSFTDPGGLHDTHTIEWDYGDGETSTGTLRPTHAYGDNGVYSVILTVTDEDGGVGSNTLSVTVHNVAPTASIDDAIYVEPGHNLHFGLPYQELRLRGSFIDAGWLDTHRATWVHENSDETRTAILTEENEQPDSTGTIEMGYYFLFEQPTYFTITLKVTDDDGDIGTDQFTGRIRSAEEAIPIVNDYIQDLPDDAFEKNPDQQKKAFSEKLNEAIELIDAGVYQEAIDKLQHDIRAKADGHVDGNPANDWITDPEEQQEICAMIDDLIAYLETLL